MTLGGFLISVFGMFLILLAIFKTGENNNFFYGAVFCIIGFVFMIVGFKKQK